MKILEKVAAIIAGYIKNELKSLNLVEIKVPYILQVGKSITELRLACIIVSVMHVLPKFTSILLSSHCSLCRRWGRAASLATS